MSEKQATQEVEKVSPRMQDFSAYELLDAVSRLIGPAPVCTVTEAADFLGATGAGLTRRFNRLVHAGYLHRRAIGGWAVAYWLTDEGEAALTRDLPIETDGYPTTPPGDTVDESGLQRRPGREGRLGTFEPLELIQDATGPVCTAGDICDATGLATSTALRRLNKLYRSGCVGRKKCGSSSIAWWLSGLGSAVLSGDARRAPVEQRYDDADGSAPTEDDQSKIEQVLSTGRSMIVDGSDSSDHDTFVVGEDPHQTVDEDVVAGRITPHPDDTKQERRERVHGGTTPPPRVSAFEILDAVANVGAPAATTGSIADEVGISEQALRKHMNRLVHADLLHMRDTGAGRVYWPTKRGEQAVRNGGKNLRRRVLLGYPKTTPESTVPYVYLSRHEGREESPDPFEPLELLQDAHRSNVQVVSAQEIADGLGLSYAATLNRLHKLRRLGLVDGVDAGSRVLAWGLADKGREVLKDDSAYVDAEAIKKAYWSSPPARRNN